MNETFGVKGGHNDRRRMIIRKEQRKKLKEAEQKELINLEKKVKNGQIMNLIKFLPVAIVRQTVQTLTNTSKNQDKKDSFSQQEKLLSKDINSSKKEQNKSILGILKNGNLVFKRDKEISNLSSKDNIDSAEKKDKYREIKPTKEIGRNTIFIPNFSSQKNSSVSSQKKSSVSSQKNSPVSSQKKSPVSSQKEFFSSSQKGSTGIDVVLNSSILEKIKGRKIVDVYERELKDLRYDLRKIIFEYNALVQEEDEVVFSKDVEDLMNRLSVLIEKIELLKSKMNINNLDKYDDNYIYTLIEDYLSEFKAGKAITSIKDSPLYILISEKLNELESKKDSFKKGLDIKREELRAKEESFEELEKKYYHIDKINEELSKFQRDQEFLLKDIQEKVNSAVTVQEKVEVQVKSLNIGLKRMINLMILSTFVPGRIASKGLAASIASYLMFAKQILHPETVSKKYKVITVEDYTADIERNIRSIEDSISMLYKTEKQIDKIIYEIEVDFADYIDVLPECKSLLSNLKKIKSAVKEKEYEMEKIKKEQEVQLENNNAKILTKGVYPQD